MIGGRLLSVYEIPEMAQKPSFPQVGNEGFCAG